MKRTGAALQLPLELEEESAEERIRREVGRGGARFERVVFTRNRRVMASVVDRGKTLRVHEVFVQARPEVLRALGQNFASRRSAVREASRAVVRVFLASAPLAAAPAKPRRLAPPPRRDLPHLARLRACFDAVNDGFFDGALPVVDIRLSGRMARRLGHFTSDPLEIVISRSLCAGAVSGEAEATLRHEMIHLWQWWTGRKPGHGADFRRWARRLDIHPRATREVCWK